MMSALGEVRQKQTRAMISFVSATMTDDKGGAGQKRQCGIMKKANYANPCRVYESCISCPTGDKFCQKNLLL